MTDSSSRNLPTAELIARYDRPGPRYTSYPTAVEFHEGVDDSTLAEHLAKANASPEQPLSLYVHLPFCHHRCLFCGCHVIISPDGRGASGYSDLVMREADLVAERLPERRTLTQLHLGGGTPTYHEPAELRRLLEHLLGIFDVSESAELAVEVDPRVTTVEHVDMLADLGFNRLSVGVQDLSPRVQEAIERIQSAEQTELILDRARERGFRGLNVDLIYGLPFQEPESFARTIRRVVEMRPDRLAVYGFAHVPWVRGHQKKLEEESFPGRDERITLFSLARDLLLESGYEAIGMDHFAAPDDELARAKRDRRLSRNFQGYAVVPAPDVLGLGISAIGDMAGAFVQNAKKLSTYRERIEAGRLATERGLVRSADDELRRKVIAELMCNFLVDVPAIEEQFGIDFAKTFEVDLQQLREHEAEGLVEIDDRQIRATEIGELFVRNLAMCFDRYLRERHSSDDKPVFSRTV